MKLYDTISTPLKNMRVMIVYTAIKTSRIILRIARLSCGAMTRTIAPTGYSGTTVKQTKVRGGWSADTVTSEKRTQWPMNRQCYYRKLTICMT